MTLPDLLDLGLVLVFMVVAIAVAGKSDEFTRPCGACRQVMVEFNPSMKVLRRGQDGFSLDTTAEELLPEHFNPDELTLK